MEESIRKQAASINPLSLRTILFHQAVADRLGLNVTDHKCVLFLIEQRHTVGELAQMTGLTMGAQTAVIERLEKGGFVRRVHDLEDRRRVFVEIIPEGIEKMAAYFTPLGEAIRALDAEYSEAEQQLIDEYSRKVADILHQETLKLRQQGKAQRKQMDEG